MEGSTSNMAGPWVDITYAKQQGASTFTCTIRASHGPTPDRFSRASWYLEIWQNYTKLEPLAGQGQGVVYVCDLGVGEELSIDGFSMHDGVFGPRARLAVESAGLQVLFLSQNYPLTVDLHPDADEGMFAA